ncbi:MAG: UDP-N-acetylglucosamine 1-carboxyvinyltransferase, partial [Phycisphaerae bacterium]|nr:UDP-N-acetylglucosamine 1-carboxyvinyltransferase [Phycisphaerae bacterium]
MHARLGEGWVVEMHRHAIILGNAGARAQWKGDRARKMCATHGWTADTLRYTTVRLCPWSFAVACRAPRQRCRTSHAAVKEDRMDKFRIQGGYRLSGRLRVEGAKNAALPLMAASLLTDGEVLLDNIASLADIFSLQKLLVKLGVDVRVSDSSISLQTKDPNAIEAPYELVRTMRASICVLGPMLARRKRAVISMPGGCAFGDRPVDLHLRGMEKLGARIEMRGGYIHASCDRLQGATVFLGGPYGSTVLGTANVMSAATLAKGRTVIESAACEPEIVDLADLLNAMGAKIRGAGGPRIIIDGVDELGGAKHAVMPDRIVAGTYAIASAITNGEIIIDDFPYDALLAVVDRLSLIGVHVHKIEPDADDRRCTVRVTSER